MANESSTATAGDAFDEAGFLESAQDLPKRRPADSITLGKVALTTETSTRSENARTDLGYDPPPESLYE
ncbi:hypothetical protein ACH46_00655 [Gordonia phthalatica]|uniref:Uncharacterized protein n=1 Tax=Gordonia phthalatica TaxID=1136941 RepID=A0A0N9N8M8_9ACTN|nr:hypothetical protein ACH46_00655 [Gordonia phthalatica]